VNQFHRKEKKNVETQCVLFQKVPAEGEYTSQSYHASIEVELPDGLSQDQLQGKIHETFAMVRDSVESELHPAGMEENNPIPVPAPVTTGVPASPKQISYLLSLASRRGITPQQIMSQHNVAALEQLSKRQVSALIEQWKAA